MTSPISNEIFELIAGDGIAGLSSHLRVPRNQLRDGGEIRVLEQQSGRAASVF